MGEKFDPSGVDGIIAKLKAGVSKTATYATSVLAPFFQSVIARKPRQDGLQQLIVEIVGSNPAITEKELLRELESRQNLGVILTVTERDIEFVTKARGEDWANGKIESAPISGIKDRLTRAKRYLNKKIRVSR